MRRIISLLAVLLLCSSVNAQVPMTGAGLAKPASGGAPTGFVACQATTPQAGTANPQPGGAGYASISLCTPAANRVVLVCVAQRDNGPTTAVAIGGTSLAQAGITSAGGTTASLWWVSLAAGATGTVNVTTTGTFLTSVAIAVGAFYTSTPTPGTSQVEAYAFNADPQTTPAITIPASGVGVICGVATAIAASPALSGGTVDFSPSDVTSGMQILLAHTTATGSVTPSVTGYNSAGYGMVATPWGP